MSAGDRATVLKRGKLKVALVTVAIMAALFSVAAIPTASAASCTVTVTLLSGQVLYFQLPPGTPVSSLNLPPGVKSISESCPQLPSTTSTTSTTPSTTSTPSSTST